MKKIKILFEILKVLQSRSVCKDDNELLQRFQFSQRTLQRHLEELQNISYSLVTVEHGYGEKGRNKNCYKLLQISDLLKSFLNYSDDLSFFVEISNVLNPEAFQKLEDDSKKALINILNSNNDIFYFKNSEFEEIENSEIFFKIKKAIKENFSINFQYRYLKLESFQDISPIRIIFSKNNWYFLGFSENMKPKVRFFRINFVEEIEFSKKRTEEIPQDVFDFILQIQNPMTLFGVKREKAVLKANSKIAIYFQENSKKFFNSQNFIECCSDGGVKFEISYTQPLEILPFIQSWLPNLEILEPQSLKDELFSNLKSFFDNF
jgi:predicted DNA-binding transcriptional regulator YafY